MREVEVKDEKRKKAVENIFKDIDVKVKIAETRKVGGNAERGTETILVRLENERREVWENTKKLRGRKKRIVEDLTWGENKMRWK